MKNNRTVNVRFYGLVSSLLGVAFIVLKLTHVIDWKWIWVLAPFWGWIALLIVLVILFVLLWFLVELGKAVLKKTE